MKKLILTTLIAAFSHSFLMGQGSIWTPLGNIEITNEVDYGIYISNNKKIKLEKILVNIANDEYSTESFEVSILSAPKMKDYKSYNSSKFKQLNNKPIIVSGKEGGGILEIDVSDMNIEIYKNFIVKISSTEESIKNARSREEKVYICGEWTGEMKTIFLYGPRFCRNKAYPMLTQYQQLECNYAILSTTESLDIEFKTVTLKH